MTLNLLYNISYCMYTYLLYVCMYHTVYLIVWWMYSILQFFQVTNRKITYVYFFYIAAMLCSWRPFIIVLWTKFTCILQHCLPVTTQSVNMFWHQLVCIVVHAYHFRRSKASLGAKFLKEIFPKRVRDTYEAVSMETNR